jgi:hypothetical protein
LVEEQLPEIAGIYPPDFKTYPDQATTTTVDRGAVLFAQKIQSEAIIPNKVGTFVIGEIVVPWFNVLSKKTEFAKLPARTIKVVPPSEEAVSNTQEISSEYQKPQTDLSDSSTNSNTVFNTKNENQAFAIDWLHIGLFALWLVNLVIFLYIIKSRRIKIRRTKPLSNTHHEEAELWKKLNNAISQGNAQETNQTMTLWLSELIGKPIMSVSQCLLSIDAKECLVQYNQMMASEYADKECHWEQDKFLIALENLRNKTRQYNKNNEDPFQLYPKS